MMHNGVDFSSFFSASYLELPVEATAGLPSCPQAILLREVRASSPSDMPLVAFWDALVGKISTDRNSEIRHPPRMPQMRDTITVNASVGTLTVSGTCHTFLRHCCGEAQPGNDVQLSRLALLQAIWIKQPRCYFEDGSRKIMTL